MEKHLILAPAITVTPVAAPVLSDDARAIKQKLLTEAALVPSIVTADNKALAELTAVEIKTHIKQITQDHEDVKKPYWAICQALDTVKRTHLEKLNGELHRIALGLGAFEQKVREEEARVEKERKDAELKLQEEQRVLEARRIELQRQQQAAELAPQPKGKSAKEAAEAAEAARLEEQFLLDEAKAASERRAHEANATANSQLTTLSEAGVKGGRVAMDYNIVVTDKKALFERWGDKFLKIEPKLAELKAAIKLSIELPGVTWTTTPKVNMSARK